MRQTVSKAKSSSSKGWAAPFPFQLLEEHRFALDRLDLSFRFGSYGIRVLRCHLTRFAPGKTVGFHKHSEFEFHFIPRGKGKVILKDKEYALHEGLFYLTGPDLIHYQEADPHEAMDELCLHIDIKKLSDADSSSMGVDEWGSQREALEAEECIRNLHELPPIPVIDQYNAMRWFLTAYRAWHENQHGAYTTIKHAIIQIMLRSVQNYTHKKGPFDIPQRDMNEYRYHLATQFIQDNYSGTITLEDVAERLHISGRQLQRILRAYAGESFKGYLENIRLSHVCRELMEGERSFEQIAAEHGFSSSNYLYYVFKKKLGLTPGQFKVRQLQDRAQLPDFTH